MLANSGRSIYSKGSGCRQNAAPRILVILLNHKEVIPRSRDNFSLNQLPYDHLRKRCDLTIAVDVCSSRGPEEQDLPNVLDAVLGAFDIMQSAALATKMRSRPPDIYVRPQVGNIRILDFAKAEEVFAQAGSAIEDLRGQLARRGLASKTLPRGTTPRART